MAAIKGGDKIKKALEDRLRRMTNATTVSIGFFEEATYPDGTPVAMVAAIQNYGAPKAGIPPRPFISNMIANKQDEWGPAIADLFKANDYDAKKTLEQAGEAIAGQLRQSLRDTNEPPLAPSTIQRKGFAKPLVDTGQMLASISYKVQ